ncbi:MAG TPA: hypothetical protein DD727_09595 [Clostridiales bacterium]|nr:hypothetical protein [Clostridiales bacterium]
MRRSRWFCYLRDKAIPKFLLLGLQLEAGVEAEKFIMKKFQRMLCGGLAGILIWIAAGQSAEALILAFMLPVIIFWAMERDLDNKVRKRRQELNLGFPVLLSKLSLLVGAGLHVTAAIRRIRQTGRKGALLREIDILLNQVEAGIPENRAFEEFALRCGTPEASMMVSVILQNVRTGGTEMTYLLRVLSASAWQGRIATAKKLGEEASEKLLLPMAIEFIAILILVTAPALMQMRIL